MRFLNRGKNYCGAKKKKLSKLATEHPFLLHYFQPEIKAPLAGTRRMRSAGTLFIFPSREFRGRGLTSGPCSVKP